MAIVQLDSLGSVIKVAYEAQPDTNPFDDAAQSKLAGIAAGATANDTNANLRNRATHTGSQAIGTISGLTDALAAISGGAFRPEDYGGLKGAGRTGAERTANTTAITNAIAAADAANGKVAFGGGIWEIAGAITAGASNIVIEGAGAKIVQFTDSVDIFTVASGSRINFIDLELEYNAAQTTGGNPSSTDTFHAAIRFTGTSAFCSGSNINFTKCWVDIGMSGVNIGHKFEALTSVKTSNSGYALVAKSGTVGCTWINTTATGNGADIACSGAILVTGGIGLEFTQARVDRLVSQRPVWLTGARNINFENLQMIGVTPTQASGYAALVHLENDSSASFENTLISGTKLNKTTGAVDFANVFAGGNATTGGGTVRAREMFVTATSKTGVTRFGIIGSTTASAAFNTFGEFEGVRLDTATATPHQVDDICFATLDGTSTAKNGIVRRFNQTVGDAIGGYTLWGNESATIHLELHGNWQRFDTALTANRSVTLSNRIAGTYGTGPLSSPLIPRGCRMKVSRTSAATGAFTLSVLNHDGGTIGTLAVGQTGDFVFDGGAWSGYGRGTF